MAHSSFYRSRGFRVLLAMYFLSYLLFVPLAYDLAERVEKKKHKRGGGIDE